jgi:acyl carrier protein
MNSFNQIAAILSDQLKVPIEKVTLYSNISQDLGADSLDIAEIAMLIKDNFDHDLTDEEIGSIKTVNDLVIIVDSKNGTKS